MNQLSNLEGAQSLSKKEQQDINGGKVPFVEARRRGCNPTYDCCYPTSGGGWAQGPPCF